LPLLKLQPSYVNNNTHDALLPFHGNNGWLTRHNVTWYADLHSLSNEQFPL